MIKAMLMVGTMLVAAPVLAQTKPGPAKPAADPATTTPAAPVAPASDATGTTEMKTDQATTAAAPQQPTTSATPRQPMTTAQTAPTPTADPATGTAAIAQQPAATGNAVADLVESEFPSYDKDSDGKLSRTEFSAWMVALKAKSDPKASATAPATKTWVAGAWTTADKDKSASVTKAELTGFLSQGQS